MPPVNPLSPTSSTNMSQVSRDSSKPEEQDIWFDAIDHVEMEEIWFKGAETFPPMKSIILTRCLLPEKPLIPGSR